MLIEINAYKNTVIMDSGNYTREPIACLKLRISAAGIIAANKLKVDRIVHFRFP